MPPYGNHITDPLAIKKYIAYAHKNLKTRYVLLVGGDTSDPNNYRKLGATSFVPTLCGDRRFNSMGAGWPLV